MILNQWYAILESNEVKKEKQISVRRMGVNLVVWRSEDGQIIICEDKCAHRGVALSAGKVVNGDIMCPFHGFRYGKEGKCTCIPAIGMNATPPTQFKVKYYIAAEKHNFIWIWWGEPKTELPDIPYFDNLDPKMKYRTVKDSWNAHYSRVIENQLDVVHVPFVHHNTIGRGNKTLVYGPKVEAKDDKLYVYIWIDNRLDDGSTPLKPEQMPERSREGQHLEFMFANIWQNFITQKMRIVIAFIPVDEEHTILYMRVYQNILKLPILQGLFFATMKLYSLIIAHQDRRVVETQRPYASGLKIGENLITGDTPIVKYRQMRDALQNKTK